VDVACVDVACVDVACVDVACVDVACVDHVGFDYYLLRIFIKRKPRTALPRDLAPAFHLGGIYVGAGDSYNSSFTWFLCLKRCRDSPIILVLHGFHAPSAATISPAYVFYMVFMPQRCHFPGIHVLRDGFPPPRAAWISPAYVFYVVFVPLALPRFSQHTCFPWFS
jgi:hypothetical protein